MGEGQEEICGEGNQSSLQSSATSEVGYAADSDNTRLKTFNNKKSILGTADRTKAFSGDGAESIHTRGWWDSFPTQSPICSGDDGLPTRLDGITFPKWRNESIKGYGNAVVPQVVHQIFKAISLYESTSHEPS
jgi:hypothetical protein